MPRVIENHLRILSLLKVMLIEKEDLFFYYVLEFTCIKLIADLHLLTSYVNSRGVPDTLKLNI